MPWIRKVPIPHNCNLPVYGCDRIYGLGSLWKCRKCKKVWQSYHSKADKFPIFRWREYTPEVQALEESK